MRPTIAIWVTRHSLAAVFIVLSVIAVAAVAGTALLMRSTSVTSSTTDDHGAVTAYKLPRPTQHPPQRRVGAAHQALHALGRACETPVISRQSKAIREPLDLIERFAVAYPGGGFSMDGEPGSTLALMVVVWDELKRCDPSYVPEVEKLIPAQYRGD